MDRKGLEELSRHRWRVAGMLTALMVAAYVAFIFSVAFGKAALTRPFVPGLSLAIVLGVGIIVLAWLLTFAYSRWANSHYDSRVTALMGKGGKR